jgi:hypothetical protein
VIVEVVPGARFAHMLEALFGLAQMGYVDDEGMPNLLQMALIGREFSDMVRFRSPPPAVQRAVFATLAPLAHVMGYRATTRSSRARSWRPTRPTWPRRASRAHRRATRRSPDRCPSAVAGRISGA